MRVLFDGNVPKKLARLLSGHDAQTIHQEGWSNLSNGALLDAAAGKYDVFLTLDQNLSYQQNPSRPSARCGRPSRSLESA